MPGPCGLCSHALLWTEQSRRMSPYMQAPELHGRALAAACSLPAAGTILCAACECSRGASRAAGVTAIGKMAQKQHFADRIV